MTITQREREHLLTARNALLDAEEALDRVVLAFDRIDEPSLDAWPFAQAKRMSRRVLANVMKLLKLPVIDTEPTQQEPNHAEHA